MFLDRVLSTPLASPGEKKKKVFQIRSGRAREPFSPPLLHRGEEKKIPVSQVFQFAVQTLYALEEKKKKKKSFTASSGTVC